MTSTFIDIIQLTDTHLFKDPAAKSDGVNTDASLRYVVQDILTHQKPHLTLLTGDLADDGHPATYKRLAHILKPLDCPLLCLAGNHDDEQALQAAGFSLNKRHVWKTWQIILLNSNKPDSEDGYLNETELAYLDDCIQTDPTQRVLLAVHHNLFASERHGVKLGVINAPQVLASFERYPQIKAVICGHIHQDLSKKYAGIDFYATPSTGRQSRTKAGMRSKKQAGYRKIRLYADGRLKTSVSRIQKAREF